MAFPLARPRRTPVIRYSEVALAATVLQDDLLASSLRQLYLDPLAEERDGGQCLRETLRAYLAAGGNASSAAAALGVHRRTVTSRLITIEERIGRPVDDATAELETALQLHEHADLDPGLRIAAVDPLVPRR
jgi:DNA-binding PucR family transcriptional regulator